MTTIYITTDQGLKNIITESLNYLRPILDENQYEDFVNLFRELIIKNKEDNISEQMSTIIRLSEEAQILKERLNSFGTMLI